MAPLTGNLPERLRLILSRSSRIQSDLTDPAAIATVGCRFALATVMHNFTHTVAVACRPLTAATQLRLSFSADVWRMRTELTDFAQIHDR